MGKGKITEPDGTDQGMLDLTHLRPGSIARVVSSATTYFTARFGLPFCGKISPYEFFELRHGEGHETKFWAVNYTFFNQGVSHLRQLAEGFPHVFRHCSGPALPVFV